MTEFNTESANILKQVAQKYNISEESVVSLANSLMRNSTSMAQFNIPELGGQGQWMRGGMIMVGDMFNHGLKARVDSICSELANHIDKGEIKLSGKSGSPDSGQYQSQRAALSGFSSMNNQWWGDLGHPNSTGSQNNMAYAIFNDKHRLAIQQNGKVIIFDTLDHQIGGVGQQQGGTYSVSFTSQKGNVNLESLPIVSKEDEEKKDQDETPLPDSSEDRDEVSDSQNEKPIEQANTVNITPLDKAAVIAEEDIFAKIEKLAELKEKGILTEQEFSSKKKEFLARL
ncbi:MAG: SHOCT domain-containing protein [Saprospiraceae bacterium]|nr:SHOCT domain-containing protein [Saprospiraceae bacterium]